MANPITNPKMYAQITGIALAAIAVLGIVLSAMGTSGSYGLMCKDTTTCDTKETANNSFLGFDWTHNVLHVVLAIVALAVGYGTMSGTVVAGYAKAFGIVYVALGALGFFMADLGILHLELGENLVHLVIGAWGIAAGFFGATMGAPTTPTTTPTRRP